jgi:hypothetical protein
MHFPVHYVDRFFLITKEGLPASKCMWIFELEGVDLERDRLERAIRDALALHPKAGARLVRSGILGARLEWAVMPDAAERVLTVHPPEYGCGAGLEAAAVEIMNRPMSPETGPLVDLHWLPRASPTDGPRTNERPVLCFRFHHALADGLASTVFLRDLFDLYNGFDVKRPPMSGAPPALVRGSVMAKLALFARLVGLHLRRSFGSAFAIPEKPFAPREARGEVRSEFATLRLSSEEIERYRRAAGGVGASFNDLLVAALSLAIEGYKRERGEDCGLLRMTINQRLRKPKFSLETVSSSFPVWIRAQDRRRPEVLLQTIRAQVRECVRRRIAQATALLAVLLKLPFPIARWLLLPALTRPRLSDSLIVSNVDGVLELLPSGGRLGRGNIAVVYPLVAAPPGIGAIVTLSSASEGTSLVLNYVAGLFERAAADRLLALVGQALATLYSSIATSKPCASSARSALASGSSASG